MDAKLVIRAARAVIFFVLLVLVGAGISLASNEPEGSSLRPSPPPQLSAEDWLVPQNYPTLGITLGPPAPGTSPRMTAQEAVAVAWGDVPSSSTSAAPFFATYSSTAIDLLPVWVVEFKGVCVPNDGPPGNSGPPCFPTTDWNVVIDDLTGELVVAFNAP
jgi:hypothetical protein